MKKALLWVRMIFYLVPMWITAKKCKKENFDVRYGVGQIWCQKILKGTGHKIICDGQENIPADKTVYFISNHQGSLDPFMFLANCPVPTTLISKIENKKIPIIKDWMNTLEMVAFKREDVRDALRMVNEVTDKLKNGRNVICYPEGTRSKKQEMNAFKAGSLKPAFKAQCTIVPVCMKNSYLIDVGGKNTNPVEIHFLKALDYEDFKDMNTQELADLLQNRIAEVLNND